jgi:hypothetical protein
VPELTVYTALEQAHARLVGALSTLSAAARTVADDGDPYAKLDRAHAVVDAIVSLLVARAREDLAGAVLPGQSYEVRVSGTATSVIDRDDADSETVTQTATERGVDQLATSPTYRRVVSALRSAHSRLTDRHRPHTFGATVAAFEDAGRYLAGVHADITPTGDTCVSWAHDRDKRRVECEGLATRRGYCSKCWPHVRDGFPPPADLLRDWNRQRDRDCDCSSTVCMAAHAHAPGRCDVRIKPGEPKRTCDTCVKRNWRARREEKARMEGGAEPDPDPARPRRPRGADRDELNVRASDGSKAFAWKDRT